MSDSEEQPPTPEADEEMEDKEVEEEEVDEEGKPKAKDYWYLPIYVKCKLCDGMYKFPVKPKCGDECKASACKACALKHVTKLNKCWNPDCEKPVTADSLETDKFIEKAVEKWFARMKKWDHNLKTGKILKCTLCNNLCQRGVSTPCCGMVACRGCAVKKIAASRECWYEPCKTQDMTSEKLVNDELLRKATEYYKENGKVDIDHAKEISAKRSELHKVIFEKNKKAKKDKKEVNKSRREPPKNTKTKKPFTPQGWKNGPRRGLGPNRGGQGPRNWQPMGGQSFHGNAMGGNDMYYQNLEMEHAQMKMMLMSGGGMGMGGGGMGMSGGGLGMNGGGMGMNGGGMGMGGGGMVMNGGGKGMRGGGMGMNGGGEGMGMRGRGGMGMRGRGGGGMGMRGGEGMGMGGGGGMGMRGRGGMGMRGRGGMGGGYW